jgi:hypothetical protein
MSDDSPLDLECPQCQKRLRVPATAVGKRIRCPACSHVIDVPAEMGTTAEPPKPRSTPRRKEPEPEPDSHDEPSRDDGDDDYREKRSVRRRRSPGGPLTGLAIVLLVIASLSLLLDLFNCGFAIFGPEPEVNAQDPAILQQIAKSSHGPLAASMQGGLAIMAIVTIVGSIQMLRRKTWGLALTACILAMIHIGSCCCVLGLPIGIWALILLVNPDVKDSFS